MFMASQAGAEERVFDLLTARGTTQRVLIDVPANPVGSVVLLAGGTGEDTLIGRDGQSERRIKRLRDIRGNGSFPAVR